MIKEIYDYLKDIQIIDTHEHLAPFQKERPRGDVLTDFLEHYFSTDLISAGLSPNDYNRIMGDGLSITEKWSIVEPFWRTCKYTGYGQSLAIAARDIYGIEEICTDTIEALNDAFQRGFEEDHYKRILKEKCNIKTSILDCWGLTPFDTGYFVAANRIDMLIQPQNGGQIMELEQATGITVCGFEDYLRACEIRLDQYRKVSRILKCALAYSRSLDFARTTRADAESAFNKLFYSGSGFAIHREEQSYSCSPDLTNYLFRHIISLAQEKGIILQIHTGLQEGNGNILAHSNPSRLNEIFHEYPNMKFDVFHIGYPYQDELGALCKMYPNVYIDMCWAHIISPVACRRILSEWLELFSYTKISGFGGDYRVLDGVYGHQYLARRNIAAALSEKVQEGLFDTEEACRIGKAILFDNPSRIFGIE